MDDSSASYIHLLHYDDSLKIEFNITMDDTILTQVQHLIEKCLIYKMSKEECMEALSKHAKIQPVITSTVWNELEKVNKEFFEAYNAESQRNNEDRSSEEVTSEMIQKMILDHDQSAKPPDE